MKAAGAIFLIKIQNKNKVMTIIDAVRHNRIFKCRIITLLVFTTEKTSPSQEPSPGSEFSKAKQ
jgi:hypothetical protein